MPRRLATAMTSIALAALALTGCSTNYGPGGSDGSGGSGFEVDAAWLAGGSLIAVVTDGSSSCTPFVDDVVEDDGVIVVSLTERTDEQQACTDDLIKRGTIIGLPEGVQPGTGIDLQVTLDGEFAETSLEAYTGAAVEDYAPSAGWVDDGVLAILTWGSSSCAPAVESTDVESSTSIVVTFVTAPADQVCTMDMAPRVAIATIEGDVSADATVKLAGGDGSLPGATIPIA